MSDGKDQPLVQWSFLQVRRFRNNTAPAPCFLHSATQIGSKILVYGGCDSNGDAISQLFLYDTNSFQWTSPADASSFQEDHPGARYGHSATLVEMHPPKIILYGGMQASDTFEFAAPDGVEEEDPSGSTFRRDFMSSRRKGKQSNAFEGTDEGVYILTLNADRWVWSKPLILSPKNERPLPRAEHSACKTGTNEITIFGGWAEKPTNDMWTFNYMDMQWTQVATSGIQPRPRFRHTAEVLGTKMYIMGGSDSTTDEAELSPYLQLHELNLETMQWSHPAIRGSDPFPRSGHGSAIIGARSVAIFGGKLTAEVRLPPRHYSIYSTYRALL